MWLSVDLDICFTLLKKILNIHVNTQLHIVEFDVKDTVCTRGVKQERERVKEFYIW